MTTIGAASAEQPARLSPPKGIVALRLPVLDSAQRELCEVLRPPWPEWMTSLYRVEEKSDPQIDVDAGETTIPAALSALAEALKHRLQILAFATGQLQELGWELSLQDDVLVATARMRPYDARHQLEEAGVAGPLCAVCELDDAGWPRMWYGGDG